MTVKAIEKEHVTKHQDGSSTDVRLSAYPKAGFFRVAKGSNRVENEIPLASLDDVLPYLAQGYMLRMRSEPMTINGKRRRIEGLYGTSEIKVLR